MFPSTCFQAPRETQYKKANFCLGTLHYRAMEPHINGVEEPLDVIKSEPPKSGLTSQWDQVTPTLIQLSFEFLWRGHGTASLLTESDCTFDVTWTQKIDPPISLLFPCQLPHPLLSYVLQPSNHSPSSDLPLIPPGKIIYTAAAYGGISQPSKTKAQVCRGKNDTQLFYRSPVSMVSRTTGRQHHYIHSLIFINSCVCTHVHTYLFAYSCVYIYQYRCDKLGFYLHPKLHK